MLLACRCPYPLTLHVFPQALWSTFSLIETDEAPECQFEHVWGDICRFCTLVRDVLTVTMSAVKREEGEAKASWSCLHHLQRHRENRLPELFRQRSLFFRITMLSWDMLLYDPNSSVQCVLWSTFLSEFTGRTNHAELIMLPKGEWPHWWGTRFIACKSGFALHDGANPHNPFFRCRICGGSGLDYCFRCHGTGEYREPMGFHFTVKSKWAPRPQLQLTSRVKNASIEEEVM